ncbi:hypothetical protein [Nocardioides sp.]|uniref:hypothetical protein n=1 Tax=Nocardioides sp. TaxID=35761 RepID=UPI0035642BC6
MTDDLSLFGADEPAVPPNQVSAPAPITDWQVDLLRKALDARGHTTMEERQQAIESAAGRKVTSLRSLAHDEGMQVLSRLGPPPSGGQSRRRSWDDREEDTWIDRL